MYSPDLHALLEAKYAQYNRSDFIEHDPISVPHRYSRKEDIEIAGFFAALLAWGKRSLIIRSLHRLMACMDDAPADFVLSATESELLSLDGFVHRTFNGVDARALVLALRRVYREAGGLEGIFSAAMQPESVDVLPALLHARVALLASPTFPPRTHKHIANPAAGSSAKRLNMYLRWMVRRDSYGVDFGLWKGIASHQLLMPLDVHTGNVGRELGLLLRRQDDWRAVQELTASLRVFDPQDPVKYDFALFGMGAMG